MLVRANEWCPLFGERAKREFCCEWPEWLIYLKRQSFFVVFNYLFKLVFKLVIDKEIKLLYREIWGGEKEIDFETCKNLLPGGKLIWN